MTAHRTGGQDRTDGGKARKAPKEEADEDKPRIPFDPRAEVPPKPSDGSFQGSSRKRSLLAVICMHIPTGNKY